MSAVPSRAFDGLAAQAQPPTSKPSASKPAGARRARRAELEICPEAELDYGATAALAAEGFGAEPGTFTAEGLRWLYERAFTDGTTVLAAYAEGRKVGQIALVHQTVATRDGATERAVALVDLFILKAHRSKAAMAALYGAVERFCRDSGTRLILAVPNGNAAGVNVRYLSLAEAARLEIRVGLGGWGGLGLRVDSRRVAELAADEGRALLGRYCGDRTTGLPSTGLLWTGARLWERLQKPGAGYGLHATDDLLLVSAPRRDRRAAHTLLCALLPRPGARPGRRAVAAAVSAACRMHRRPIFVYAGVNDAVPLPGLLLPARYRPSPMILQMRDFAQETAQEAAQGTAGGPPEPPLTVSRFEALDFDFA